MLLFGLVVLQHRRPGDAAGGGRRGIAAGRTLLFSLEFGQTGLLPGRLQAPNAYCPGEVRESDAGD